MLIANCYAPNNDNPEFFHSFCKEIKRFTPQYTIIGGDFNLVLDLEIDKYGGQKVTNFKARDILLANIAALELVDVWRNIHADKAEFTWRRLRPNPILLG